MSILGYPVTVMTVAAFIIGGALVAVIAHKVGIT